MIYTELTKKALRLAFDAHRDQVDKTGLPYVFHPFHLAEQMEDEITVACALLHDVVEDTDYTFEALASMGFPEEVLEPLRLLTHNPVVPYMDYVRGISAHPVARAVKLADLRHNSDLSRMEPSQIDDWALMRQKKYLAAIELLTEEKEKSHHEQ
ncbi:MAG: bifunctional (p)ppGpp synthetase/guanosine-3',5'-bis(diphosphate) 3'-pyrophosphohydrolase [Ruminococcaceae bacterium]|nr:bifunctional (p)ppGpp synthetase/guanosine-3',5'-bis(diphosphate) 3'-pyrophosphohydrolase [Oscillospiraceae bacterium]